MIETTMAWIVASIVVTAAFVLIFSARKNFKTKREYEEKIEKYEEKIEKLHEAYSSLGRSKCCSCGKPYEPLNDVEHFPELNLCRDCLWILYYDTLFSKEDLDELYGYGTTNTRKRRDDILH